ncbi:hypothetical protein BJ980_002398 [Nocardioides daedukensis]|uniref:YbdD/YjiX family protein n=1 Tax=Nocardioides daedukensis TaxID=634462 RepID=A0A7Y9UVX5_9ACTN|nr:CstA-like transporter-associated (seleno)protein [Nocardioides daedukensis]NYG59475.1 hypothetical protein [Nocardioides daedukensis]
MRLFDEVRRLWREASGQERWERYVVRSRAAGLEPMSRRDWERRRSDHRDAHPEGRCC